MGITDPSRPAPTGHGEPHRRGCGVQKGGLRAAGGDPCVTGTPTHLGDPRPGCCCAPQPRPLGARQEEVFPFRGLARCLLTPHLQPSERPPASHPGRAPGRLPPGPRPRGAHDGDGARGSSPSATRPRAERHRRGHGEQQRAPVGTPRAVPVPSSAASDPKFLKFAPTPLKASCGCCRGSGEARLAVTNAPRCGDAAPAAFAHLSSAQSRGPCTLGCCHGVLWVLLSPTGCCSAPEQAG